MHAHVHAPALPQPESRSQAGVPCSCAAVEAANCQVYTSINTYIYHDSRQHRGVSRWTESLGSSAVAGPPEGEKTVTLDVKLLSWVAPPSTEVASAKVLSTCERRTDLVREMMLCVWDASKVAMALGTLGGPLDVSLQAAASCMYIHPVTGHPLLPAGPRAGKVSQGCWVKSPSCLQKAWAYLFIYLSIYLFILQTHSCSFVGAQELDSLLPDTGSSPHARCRCTHRLVFFVKVAGSAHGG